jgi:hypothetical protein
MADYLEVAPGLLPKADYGKGLARPASFRIDSERLTNESEAPGSTERTGDPNRAQGGPTSARAQTHERCSLVDSAGADEQPMARVETTE